MAIASARGENKFITYLQGGDPTKLPKKPPGPSQRAIDLPTFQWFNWQTLQQVSQAINNLDFGIVRDAALLWDWMLRDDRVGAVLEKRINGLLGLPIDFEPAGETKKSARISDDLKDEFWKMYPSSALFDIMRWGLGLGVGLGQLVYDKQRDGSYRERLQPWHPQFMYWNWTERLFFVITQNKGNIPIHPDDPEWFLFTPYGMQLGWFKSLVRGLFMPWIIRQFAMRDWARFSEIHGKPIRKAIYPAELDSPEKDEFFQALGYLSSETIIKLPRSPDGQILYDIELVEAKSETWEGIKELKKDMDDCISIRTLGQNLTTDQKQGSLAATKQHAQQQSISVKSDGDALATYLHDGPVRYWSAWNYAGGDVLVPWARWQTEPPDDLQEKSGVLLAVSQALQGFQLTGAPVDTRQILEDFSIPVRDEGESGEMLPPPGTPAPVDPNDPRVPVDPSIKPMEPAPEKLARYLLEAAGHGTGLGNQHNGQVYVDGLADMGIEAGVKALRKDLNGVLSEIRAAKNAKDLKNRLKARYKSMKPDKFSAIMKASLVMAHLAGKGAAAK